MSDSGAESTKDLMQKAVQSHRDGCLTDAIEAYQKVLGINPEQSDAMQLLGVVHAQMGNLAAAIDHVRRSIELNPDQPGALNNLGNMLVEDERLGEAIDAYERSIHLKPDDARTHHNLGHTYFKDERLIDAVNAYQRAVELEPEKVLFLNDYGDALSKIGRFQEAVDVYTKVITIEPEVNAPRESLGKALLILGHQQEAKRIYEEWLEREPDNPIPAHFLQVCVQSEGVPATASKAYVKQTFDDFADSFDSLLEKLDYRVPDLIGDIVRDRYPAEVNDLRVVDLGCGTGLCGKHLRPFAHDLIGVDLSPNMLDKARKRDLYDELIEQELAEYLNECSEPFDLMVSADTLIYIGDLDPTFAAAAMTLRPAGALVFSLEKMLDSDEASAGPGYRLGVSGRYVHTKDYVRNRLNEHGLLLDSIEETVVRKEGFDDVVGFLVVALRAPEQTSASEKIVSNE